MRTVIKVYTGVLIGVLIFPVVAGAGLDSVGQYLMRAEDTPWVTMARVVHGLGAGAVALDQSSVFAASKTLLALVAAGQDPRKTTRGDLVQYFLTTYVHDGQIGDPQYVNDDFWGIMALRSAGVPVSDPSIGDARRFVMKAQKENGGWSWSPTYPVADTDDTAAAVMALVATGMSMKDAALQRARDYLRNSQNQDGGFPNVPPGQSSVESTAWVMSALHAIGEEDTGRHNVFLQTQMRGDGSWGTSDATAFAVIALAGKWYPVNQIPQSPPLSKGETKERSSPQRKNRNVVPKKSGANKKAAPRLRSGAKNKGK